MTFPFGFPLFLTGFCLTGGMVAFSEAKTSTVRDVLWLPALFGAFYFFTSADSPRLLFTSILLDLLAHTKPSRASSKRALSTDTPRRGDMRLLKAWEEE